MLLSLKMYELHHFLYHYYYMNMKLKHFMCKSTHNKKFSKISSLAEIMNVQSIKHITYIYLYIPYIKMIYLCKTWCQILYKITHSLNNFTYTINNFQLQQTIYNIICMLNMYLKRENWLLIFYQFYTNSTSYLKLFVYILLYINVTTHPTYDCFKDCRDNFVLDRILLTQLKNITSHTVEYQPWWLFYSVSDLTALFNAKLVFIDLGIRNNCHCKGTTLQFQHSLSQAECYVWINVVKKIFIKYVKNNNTLKHYNSGIEKYRFLRKINIKSKNTSKTFFNYGYDKSF